MLITVSSALFPCAQARVLIKSTPDEGIQPRMVNDKNGDVHLLYFKAREGEEAKIGNLYYRQYIQDKNTWSHRVRVTTQSYSHLDAVGRAGIAVDGDGRIHVVWYQVRPEQYFYTRSNVVRTGFEPQRSIVMDNLEGLDAGADITARGRTVAIVWAAGDLMHEAKRSVYAIISLDGGISFGEEQQFSDPAKGVCACCGLAADLIQDNELAVAYRSAVNGNGRHMQLLSADLQQGQISGSSDYYKVLHPLQQWNLAGCPVTTNSFTEGNNPGAWLVFESEGRIIQLNLRDSNSISPVDASSTMVRQKNPVIAFNDRNEKLVAWGEAAGHVSGGVLKFRLFSNTTVESSEPGPELNQHTNIPNYSFPAAAALRDGSFLILY